MSRVAVVLFNLGGPDSPTSVRPFLFNLFRDPAILRLPAVVRYPLAALISTTRAKASRANYALMGGRSPILPETQAQAQALQERLSALAQGDEVRVFVAMRYWRPLVEETARVVAEFRPDEVILAPLYPQFSTTTTGSSIAAWLRAYRGPGKSCGVGCYPLADGWIMAGASAVRRAWEDAGKPGNLRLIFSAHGLPQQVIDAGDPYQAQIEATAAALATALPEFPDWQVAYQSRVGRLKWIEPSTEAAIRAAGAEGKGVLIYPLAFVSEHVETRVELDHEYAALARNVGVATYLRAETVGVSAEFIDALAGAVAVARDKGAIGPYGTWRCPKEHTACICRESLA